MKTLNLGSSGPDVSAVCLGTMYFGTRTDEATAVEILDQYEAAGGFFLDTANKYACWMPGAQGGESEAVLGRWMRAHGNRARMFVASKLGLVMPGVERGLRAAQIEQECEKSLRRLQTDVIDLYYAHIDDRATPMEETLSAFDRLVQAGKVRYLGASNYAAWRLAQARQISAANGWAGYACVQMKHTFLRPHPFVPQDNALQVASGGEMLDYCRSEGVRMLGYSPLLGGAYARGDRRLPAAYDWNDSEARLRRLHGLAAERGVSANQVVLAWMLAGDPVVIPVAAVSSPAQLKENLGAVDLALTAADMAVLEGEGVEQDERNRKS